ncbi:E3 ubiquitin-protein ligase TRIM47 [Zootoca vivipara]|uniref:E3 ubiquitin-protein ligase TRIM47 n=1 Tax=Zootoca vivipara TaxID=8524 RepID=UPI00293B940B|nr:E3 ubiquitin-protein ligase TRIM47 [Zootoca vivipara]
MGGVGSPAPCLALPWMWEREQPRRALFASFSVESSSMDAGSGPIISPVSHLQEGPFSCPICLDALKDPVTTPCGHNFCLSCLGAHRHHPGAVAAGSGAPSNSRCPLCQEPFPADLQLRKNHTLAELLQVRQPAPSSPGLAMAPDKPPEPCAPGDSCAPSEDAPPEEVLCDFCTDGERARAAQSCLVCLASFCSPHLQPHLKSPAFQGHRLVPPLRHIEESLCKLHLKPLESFCRTDRSCICQLCKAQEHRGHEVVAVEVEREHVEAQRPKILNSVENQLDELGVTIAQTRRTVDLIKGTAQKEKEKVSKLFAETARVLAAFQKEVLGFIEDGERAMLIGAAEELRQKEERRDTLTEHKRNLEKVPSTDTISFLQEFQALKIATEEKSFSCASFPKELSFIKSSQAVLAVKEMLVNICKNRWDQLSGNGDEGPILYGMPEVTIEPPIPEKSSNPACLESRDYFLKFAFIIDLDSDTADKFLQLFGTKGAKRVLNPIAYPETSTRFVNCEQVLGENLMNRGNYYWEVEIIDGWVSIGVITEGYNPQESYDRGRLGRNENSCCLQWNGQNYVAWFGGFDCVIQQPFFHTIGVYLEYSEKVLTFYGVKDSKMTCLQQFKVARFKKGHFDPFQNKINHQFPALFTHNLKPAFFLESVDAHMQLGPLKKDCVSVLKRR